MAMRRSWFHHPDCTTAQADELMAQYRRRGVEVERSLNADLQTWTVSAKLPEGKQAGRPSRCWQSRMWG
jgi:hypothetical protein